MVKELNLEKEILERRLFEAEMDLDLSTSLEQSTHFWQIIEKLENKLSIINDKIKFEKEKDQND